MRTKDNLMLYLFVAALFIISIWHSKADISNIEDMQRDILQLQVEQTSLMEENAEPEVIMTDPKCEYLGQYQITYYCACDKCTNGTGITASGQAPIEGETIAAEGFPIGTKLLIMGHVYTVEDRFGDGVGGKIDIFVNSHEEAVQNGRKTADVYFLGD